MDKYCWHENEINIADSFCEFCEFKFEEDKEKCAKFDNIPQEYYSNETLCPFFERKGRIIL